MKDLLNELRELLEKHDATIVRSGDDTHKLVLCINNDEVCKEEEFEEDINPKSIVNGWHKSL
jgi:hypothetical protein